MSKSKCEYCGYAVHHRGDRYCSSQCYDSAERLEKIAPNIDKELKKIRPEVEWGGADRDIDRLLEVGSGQRKYAYTGNTLSPRASLSQRWRQAARESEARIIAKYGVKLPKDDRDVVYKI